MKRLHINLQVAELATALEGYKALLGMPPTLEKTDYAKWDLDDPALSLSLTARGNAPGLDHVGIKFDDKADLDAAMARLESHGENFRPQENANCCYANSDKAWWTDPAGLAWELFVTHAQVERFGADTEVPGNSAEDSAASTSRRSACC